MTKVCKWELAAEFLNKYGRITSMDIINICQTSAPHKYLQILKKKIGLEELKNTGKSYKIFIKADNQLNLNF